MTKKHFEAIARALAQALAQSLEIVGNDANMRAAVTMHHRMVIALLNIEFNAFNPGFDAARFENASNAAVQA